MSKLKFDKNTEIRNPLTAKHTKNAQRTQRKKSLIQRLIKIEICKYGDHGEKSSEFHGEKVYLFNFVCFASSLRILRLMDFNFIDFFINFSLKNRTKNEKSRYKLLKSENTIKNMVI
jgi:hypothetical protein